MTRDTEWLEEAKQAKRDRVNDLISDVGNDSMMRGVPRYQPRYDDDHLLLYDEVKRLRRTLSGQTRGPCPVCGVNEHAFQQALEDRDHRIEEMTAELESLREETPDQGGSDANQS